MHTAINNISKIVSKAINEAFDFNEVSNNDDTIIDNMQINDVLVIHALRQFTYTYFDYKFDIKEWQLHYNPTEKYYMLFPKDLLKFIDHDKLTLDFIPEVAALEMMPDSENNPAREAERKHCVKIYNKITKEFILNYTDQKYQRCYAHCPFYTRDFMIFHNSFYYPPLIYINASNNNINIDLEPNLKKLYFSTLFLQKCLKEECHHKFYEYYGNVNTIYEFNQKDGVIFKLENALEISYNNPYLKFTKKIEKDACEEYQLDNGNLIFVKTDQVIRVWNYVTMEKNERPAYIIPELGSHTGYVGIIVLKGDLYNEWQKYMEEKGAR